MPADRPAILTEGLAKRFGNVEALRGIDLSVRAGTVLGLLGPNGAGKTTAVRILTTLLRPDGGRAEVAGLDVVRDAPKLRGLIGLAGQYAAVDETLTGRENLELVGRLYHIAPGEVRARADDLLERFGLSDAADRMVKTYSGGMRRRLDLGASLVGRPQVLFLDEPTTGLDPRSRLGMWDLIHDLVEQGTTLLLTTQYLDEADVLSDRIAVIDGGLVIAEGTADELKSKVGGEVVELLLADRSRMPSALALLDGLGTEAPHADVETGRVTIPVGANGAAVLADLVRRFDGVGMAIAELGLRRPTLDEVFLVLTGHTAEERDREPAGGRNRRRRRTA